jgi:FkbM family methyltransferase
MIPNKIVKSNYGTMIINTNDQYIGRSIEQYGQWAADDIDLISRICDFLLQSKPKIIIYDVGSNIGSHTVALAYRFGERVQIRAFEAQRQIYYMLCGNVAINGLDNVYCEYAAVSDVVGSLSIQVPDYKEINNFGGVELQFPVHSDNQTMNKPNMEFVQTVTIDGFNESVDFIKMDIEGMEHLALAGAINTLTSSRPICFVEMVKTDQLAVKKIFGQSKYRAYAYKDDDWLFVPDESELVIGDREKITLE